MWKKILIDYLRYFAIFDAVASETLAKVEFCSVEMSKSNGFQLNWRLDFNEHKRPQFSLHETPFHFGKCSNWNANDSYVKQQSVSVHVSK